MWADRQTQAGEGNKAITLKITREVLKDSRHADRLKDRQKSLKVIDGGSYFFRLCNARKNISIGLLLEACNNVKSKRNEGDATLG